MFHKKTWSQALTHKTQATEHINHIANLGPHVQIALRWCPGHQGVKGNEEAERLSTTAVRKALPPEHTNKLTFSWFRAAINAWAAKTTLASYTPQDIRRLGHKPHPKEHLKALTSLKKKHSYSTITQLRTGEVPLYHYLPSRSLRTDITCECGLSPATVEHFFFHCPLHNNRRQDLQRELK